MALALVLKTTNFLAYRPCTILPDPIIHYGPYCTLAHPWMESIALFDSFVYDQTIDRYRFIVIMSVAYYPSWEYWHFIIHPETGLIESKGSLLGYATAHAWTDPMVNGGLGQIYAGYIFTGAGQYGVVGVQVPDGIPTQDQIDHPYVDAARVPPLAVTNYGFALCPERKLITIMSASEGLVVYNYATNPATKLYWHPFPEAFGWSMGYEDDRRCWSLYCGSIFGQSNDGRQSLLKYDYVANKIELVSELQVSGTPDVFAKIAWDTKRKKLAAIRIKADAADGAARNSFEIYSPRPAITKVTVPVNIDRMSARRPVSLISHITGTKGEAGGTREVSISCAPTATLITQPKQLTGANGRVLIQITPLTAGATEAVSVSYNETTVTS